MLSATSGPPPSARAGIGRRRASARTLRPRRRSVVVVLVVTLIAGAAYVVSRVLPHLDGLTLSEGCVATALDSSVDLEPDQAGNAATIAAIGSAEGVGERGVAVGLAAAMQESKLRNLDYGDRDSVGLFQQRPSQGWGTRKQILDPVYASTKFFEALKKVPRYSSLPIEEAAQAVQRSGFGSLYAQHDLDARVLAAVLTGRVRKGLTCELRGEDQPDETEGASGLTPRAAAVRSSMEDAFGKLSLGGFTPGGVSTGHIEGSAHYDGRAIDVFFRPVNSANRREGWALASWLVANADHLHIATVIYDDSIWSRARSDEGWRAYDPSGGAEDSPSRSTPTSASDATRRHLDHVHVDVVG